MLDPDVIRAHWWPAATDDDIVLLNRLVSDCEALALNSSVAFTVNILEGIIQGLGYMPRRRAQRLRELEGPG